MDVAAVIFIPLLQIFRSQKCVIETGHPWVRFARVKCLVVADEIVHLHRNEKNFLLSRLTTKCVFVARLGGGGNEDDGQLFASFVFIVCLYRTYPIDEANFIKVNPVWQELIAQRGQWTFVPKHKLLRRHFDNWLAVCVANNQINRQTEKICFLGGDLSDTLQMEIFKQINFISFSTLFRPIAIPYDVKCTSHETVNFKIMYNKVFWRVRMRIEKKPD